MEVEAEDADEGEDEDEDTVRLGDVVGNDQLLSFSESGNYIGNEYADGPLGNTRLPRL